jgi:putative transposase
MCSGMPRSFNAASCTRGGTSTPCCRRAATPTSGRLCRRAYRAASAAATRRQLSGLAVWLERDGHADAAASLREGLEETLTVLKLGLPAGLRRFFATTNYIENLIGTLRHVTRNIKRWRDGDMRRRWLGLLRAAERFRRIKRDTELDALVIALGISKTAADAA